ncbi:MAG: hypothetical protein GXO00_02590 [Candidatus Diapherotrites archaeon]|nr:hypothetical protein [Candidatus Diapherotrites archaeon]
MDNKEVALELLKLYLQYHRERMDLEHLVEAYLAILAALEGGLPSPAPQEAAPQTQGSSQPDDDSLFDFKEPLSLSDKEA